MGLLQSMQSVARFLRYRPAGLFEEQSDEPALSGPQDPQTLAGRRAEVVRQRTRSRVLGARHGASSPTLGLSVASRRNSGVRVLADRRLELLGEGWAYVCRNVWFTVLVSFSPLSLSASLHSSLRHPTSFSLLSLSLSLSLSPSFNLNIPSPSSLSLSL